MRSDLTVRIALDAGARSGDDEQPSKRRAGEAQAVCGAGSGPGTVLHVLQLHHVVVAQASEWARGLAGGWAKVRRGS